MKSWNDITLFKYLQVEGIHARKGIPEIDKTLFSVCAIYGMTEHQLDNAGLKKANKLAANVASIFSSQPEPRLKKRFGLYRMNYDIGSMSFGQYIEIAFFLSVNPLANAHKLMASISIDWRGKNKAKHHGKKSEYFMRAPITDVLGSLNQLKDNFVAFNKLYTALFGLDTEVHGTAAKVHPFNKRYGWIYSASQIAEYERITLEEAYALPVRQAFHDLSFLKAKAEYETYVNRLNSITINNTTNGR